MKCKVSKPFRWCADGFTAESLVVGDVRDFGSSASGLMQEYFIIPTDEFLAAFDAVEAKPITTGVVAIENAVGEEVVVATTEQVVVQEFVAPTEHRRGPGRPRR